jgi:hypothetical protein
MTSPIPQELTNKAGVPALESATRSDVARLQTIPHDVASALASVRSAVSSTRANSDLTPDGRSRQQDAARSAAQARISALQTEAGDLFDRVQGVASIAQRPVAIKDTNAALLDELQTQKAWARVERRLSGSAPELLAREAGVIAREAQAAADETTLRAMYLELPSYMYSRGAGRLADIARAQLLGMGASFLTPVYVAAQALIDAVASNRTTYGFLFESAITRAAGDGGIGSTQICVGWDAEIIR